MIKRIAIVFGALFVLAGILGFMPGDTAFEPGGEEGRLFGAFAVDDLHNAVHVLTGIAAIAVGLTTEAACRMFFRIFGVIYGLVAVAGFAYGSGPLFGIMANNLADAALHTLVATVALFLGFGHLLERFEHHGDPGTHHPA